MREILGAKGTFVPQWRRGTMSGAKVSAGVSSLFRVFKLLLPALFPSWRFFEEVTPSPRIELSLQDSPGAEGEAWRECRERQPHLTPFDRFKAFFWNAHWNETLFLASCAERMIQEPSEHSSREIRRRLRADLMYDAGGQPLAPFFRYRLVFVSRHEGELRRDVAYVSPPFPTVDPAEP